MTSRRIRTIPSVQNRAIELRKEMTAAEQVLWGKLRNRKVGGYKFRRQHPIGPYIVDFYCSQAGLIIELDGEIHLQMVEYDNER